MRTLLLAAALLGAPALAQTAQAPDAGPGRNFDPAAVEQRMAQHRAQRAQDIATVLALKPSQKPALDQWLAAMAPPPRPDRRTPPAGAAMPRTTAEMLDRRQQRLADRQQRESGRIEATKRFYAALDGRQKAVFDALERLRHDRPHGGPHGGGMRGPGGDMPPPPERGM